MEAHNFPAHDCIIIIISLLFLGSTSSDECKPIKLTHGLNLLNCSGAGLTELPELPDGAEVLDFSRNKFMELPKIPKSSSCYKSEHCKVVNESDNNCRYDISFSRNEIIDIPGHVLKELQCVRTLDLSYNSIRSTVLDIETFQTGLYRAENLILRGNPLGRLPDDVITPPFLRHIKYLDLSHCQLEEIGENSVDDHSELVTLDLSYNKLSELKTSTFKGLSALRVLDLSHNSLETLDHNVFADLSNLDVLQLANNKISSFASKAFDRDSTLQTIDISNNNLQYIPYLALQELPNLSHLIISYNPLLSVSPPSRSNLLPKVMHLEIEGTPLTALNRRDLAAFPSISILSIRKNKNLNFIHPEFLSRNVTSLREVRLEFNGLTTLAEDALPWKQLSVLQLEGNPWMCDYRIRWMITALTIHPNTVICEGPPQYKGRDIKTLNPGHLQKPFSVSYIVGLILTAICLPVMGICAFLIWKQRSRLSCCREVKGRYVSVYTRDDDGVENGEDRVNIQVEINRTRLRTVSNGTADDSLPFITIEKLPEPSDLNLKHES